jgi:hypothetical protein
MCMTTETIRQQFKENFVAIISLIVAIIALTITTWREEWTERNRNTRMAAFEVLKNLGELQIVVNASYYQNADMKGDPFQGWGYIALIGDMSSLLPPPVPETVDKLTKAWNGNWDEIKSNEKAVELISAEINASRAAVLKVIHDLR